MLHLEVAEVLLIDCNFVNIDHQQGLRVLYTFFPTKSLGELLNISLKIFVFLKTY